MEISVEYLLLIEEKMKDVSEERTSISRGLPWLKSGRNAGRYVARMNELDSEQRSLWRRYRLLSEFID